MVYACVQSVSLQEISLIDSLGTHAEELGLNIMEVQMSGVWVKDFYM